MTGIPNFNPILDHISEKLKKDIGLLGAALNHAESMRNFGEQSRLLSEIQAGIRSVDVLGGKVHLDGAATRSTPQVTKIPAPDGKVPMGTVDLAALSKAIEAPSEGE